MDWEGLGEPHGVLLVQSPSWDGLLGPLGISQQLKSAPGGLSALVPAGAEAVEERAALPVLTHTRLLLVSSPQSGVSHWFLTGFWRWDAGGVVLGGRLRAGRAGASHWLIEKRRQG